MKVLHLTPTTNGYEVVTLLANQISKTNSLALIQGENDVEPSMTGGILLNDTPEIREVLDTIPKHQQYYMARDFRQKPYASQMYGEEPLSVEPNPIKEETNQKPSVTSMIKKAWFGTITFKCNPNHYDYVY